MKVEHGFNPPTSPLPQKKNPKEDCCKRKIIIKKIKSINSNIQSLNHIP
uniref:Uncharacterized protein n=1 Tax=Anguilla anguilla TaxID=7936 RepID=A0A0E9PQJ4_ANGAN